MPTQAVAENQPLKNRMISDLSIYAARLREFISICTEEFGTVNAPNSPADQQHADAEFNGLALVLFALQFAHNAPYRRICEARRVTPDSIAHWWQIPAVPAAAFKELELTCLPPDERTHVFHSSGTTEQRPSRHFHSAESLAVYEASLWPWFWRNLRFTICDLRLAALTPPPAQAPCSSLVHMFEIVRTELGAEVGAFVGRVNPDGSWMVDVSAATSAVECSRRDGKPLLLLGTAFSFVHLLDALESLKLDFRLPPGSRVMETGGYKGRSRALPKTELHALITERLGVPASNIICEYGMSELSSQAYEVPLERRSPTRLEGASGAQCAGSETGAPAAARAFHFPPWARAQVVSPETGREVADGETGLIRVFDLANVFSVLAVQTEDLAMRRGAGFELIGRAQLAEPRGCSLTAV